MDEELVKQARVDGYQVGLEVGRELGPIEIVTMTDVAGEPGGRRSWAAVVDPSGVLAEIQAERLAQDEKCGEQNHEDGTVQIDRLDSQPLQRWTFHAVNQRNRTNLRALDGDLAWSDILAEEVAEAFAETDPVKLRTELIQVAAVAVAWVECIDRRES